LKNYENSQGAGCSLKIAKTLGALLPDSRWPLAAGASPPDPQITLLIRTSGPRTSIDHLLVFGSCEKKAIQGFFTQ